MRWFINLSVKTKVISVVTFVALLSLADGLFLLGELGDTNDQVATVATNTRVVGAAGSLRDAVFVARINTLDLFLAQDAATATAKKQAIPATEQAVASARPRRSRR